MIQLEKEIISRSISVITNAIKDKRVVIFGKNAYTPIIINILEDNGVEVSKIFDNDSSKHGECWGIDVCKPYKLSDDTVIYLIASRFYSDMKNQLIDLGVCHKCIIRLMDVDFYYKCVSLYEENMILLEEGEKTVTRIDERYGDIPTLVFPSASLGDASLPGRHIRYAYDSDKVLALVRSKAICDVLEPVSNLCFCILSEFEMKSVEKYYWTYCDRLCNYEYVHTTPSTISSTRIGYETISYKGHSFAEAFGKTILKHKNETRIKPIRYSSSSKEDIDSMLIKNGLKPLKTIFFVPWTNTMRIIPYHFWNRIVAYANDRGFTVCTNIGNPKKEKAIKGTIPLMCEIRDLPMVVERCGYSIMARSGISDIIGYLSGIKKIVIYGDDMYSFCDVFSFNDLRKGDIDINAEQIVISERDEAKSIRRIEQIIDTWV